MSKDSWLYTLFRHQIAGFLSTLIDFGVTIFLTEAMLIWYVYSNATGALFGATANFFISSYWAFAGSKNKLINQLWKYVIVSFGSLMLNTLAVYLLTDWMFEFDYKLSKIIVAITLAWSYNFLLMRYFVFKK